MLSHQCEVCVTFVHIEQNKCMLYGTISISVSIYNALLMFVISMQSGNALGTFISLQNKRTRF